MPERLAYRERAKKGLIAVINKEKSVAEMEAEFVRIKEIRASQTYFTTYTNCNSWKEAQER